MIAFFLTDCAGARYALPEALEWKLQYTAGTPCDSFDLLCPWGMAVEQALDEAVRFAAVWDGETVFSGVVDEYELRWDEKGGSLAISGRGMAALLLDNEAVGQEYQLATAEDILRDHVTPYGIQVADRTPLPAVAGFSVVSGSSEWQVLYDFARYHGGVEPRFDRTGRLMLVPEQDGEVRVLDGQTPVTALAYRDRRYGVLSEILVRDRTTMAVQRVENRDFLRQGGRCRRVLTMPGRSSYQAMRYSGQYQLDRAAEGRMRLEATIPQAFFAWPGECFSLRMDRHKLSGLWRVLESEAGCGAAGVYTKLRMERKK